MTYPTKCPLKEDQPAVVPPYKLPSPHQQKIVSFAARLTVRLKEHVLWTELLLCDLNLANSLELADVLFFINEKPLALVLSIDKILALKKYIPAIGAVNFPVDEL
jgi:hypothetical protein